VAQVSHSSRLESQKAETAATEP